MYSKRESSGTLMIKRIGFACKWIDGPSQIDGIKQTDNCKQYNTGSTTVAWLNRQTKEVAEQKLWDLMVGNIESTRKLVELVGEQHEDLRMVRLSSDILPVYTQQDWCGFWRLPDVRAYCERAFGAVGALARKRSVRLSMHPGQFTVLASSNPGLVGRSIEEFEYHADLARYMGFARRFQDFKCNVHIGGKLGPQGILDVVNRLSPEARNIITIENDEFKWGIEDSLVLSHHVALVLDIHHHWIRTGEYFDPRDYDIVQESWRGVRPVIHYSCSREDVLVDHCTATLPNYDELMSSGFTRSKLRAHSDMYWNRPLNDYARTFMPMADIMLESKMKNLSSRAFVNEIHT